MIYVLRFLVFLIKVYTIKIGYTYVDNSFAGKLQRTFNTFKTITGIVPFESSSLPVKQFRGIAVYNSRATQ